MNVKELSKRIKSNCSSVANDPLVSILGEDHTKSFIVGGFMCESPAEDQDSTKLAKSRQKFQSKIAEGRIGFDPTNLASFTRPGAFQDNLVREILLSNPGLFEMAFLSMNRTTSQQIMRSLERKFKLTAKRRR